MLYQTLKLLFGFAVKHYFREIVIHNEDNIPKDMPLILLPNHTSAFMDPIAVATQVPRSVNFLARGESFQNPILSKIFGVLHMIPIYRREYSPDEVSKNDDIFIRCFELLEKKGCLMIFPEGVSQMEATLMPLKSGSARIALGAAARNDFKLNICLLPIGINYTNPHALQGKLFLNVGKPIYTADYEKEFRENSDKTIHKLTDEISDELKKRIVIVDDRRWVNIAEKGEQIIQAQPNDFKDILDLSDSTEAGWFVTRKQILKVITFIGEKDGFRVLEELDHRLDEFFLKLNRSGLKNKILNPLGKHREKTPRKRIIALYFILFFPIFVIGTLLHIVPYKCTELAARLIVKRPDFRGSVLLASGLFIFLGWFLFLAYILYQSTFSIFAVLALAVFMPVVGLIAFRYLIRLKRLSTDFKILRKGSKARALVQELRNEQQELIDFFKESQARYVQFLESQTKKARH